MPTAPGTSSPPKHPPADAQPNQFGAILGGAVRKDKDFVFFSFEGWREIQPASVITSVPPTLLRDGQHFSDFGYTIHDPLTTAPCGPPVNCRNSAYVRLPFAGNMIPQSRISPISQKVLSYYPKENYTPNPKALSANYYTNTNGRYRYDQPIGRWTTTSATRTRSTHWSPINTVRNTGTRPAFASGRQRRYQFTADRPELHRGLDARAIAYDRA